MSKTRVLELLPFFALISIAVIVSSAALASAGFAFPDLFGKWSFGLPTKESGSMVRLAPETPGESKSEQSASSATGPISARPVAPSGWRSGSRLLEKALTMVPWPAV